MDTNRLITVLASTIGGMGVLLAIYRLGILSYLYDARVEEDGINFLVFCCPVWKLDYTNILCVREEKWLKLSNMSAVSFRNRLSCRAFVIVKKKGWYARKIIITPADPMFLKSVLLSKNVECT
jgi:hypothetical protein